MRPTQALHKAIGALCAAHADELLHGRSVLLVDKRTGSVTRLDPRRVHVLPTGGIEDLTLPIYRPTAGVPEPRPSGSVGPVMGTRVPTLPESGSVDPSNSRFLGGSGAWKATSSHTPTVFLWSPPPSERYRGPWVGSAVRSGGVASPGKRGCR